MNEDFKCENTKLHLYQIALLSSLKNSQYLIIIFCKQLFYASFATDTYNTLFITAMKATA